LSAPKQVVAPASLLSETVENFNSPIALGAYNNPFPSVLGAYQLSNTSKFQVIADNQYGSGDGQYMSFGAQSGTSGDIRLDFTAPQAFFGFSWQAGDNLNGVTFYNNSTVIGRFSTAVVNSLLSGTTVTSIDGTPYTTAQYKGHPVNGQNNGQNYGFLNFIATDTMITSVIFDNSNSSGSGFETDNHTIQTAAPTPDPKAVFVSSVVAVPEPAPVTLVLGALPLFAAAIASRRRRE